MNAIQTAGAELVVETGALAGMRFLLDRQLITIGRAGDNDIQLDDEMVSKNHCRIITQGDNFLIEDLASSNGTIVNGDQVNTHMLQNDDKLFLGQTTLTFRKAATTVPVAVAAAAPKSRKKSIWIAVGILGGLVLVAVGVVFLLFVVLQAKDDIKPNVSLKAPTVGQVLEMNMPIQGQKVQVPIALTGSDNKGLDRVEVYINNNVVQTLKAVKSRREVKTSGPEKTEDFTTSWETTSPGEYSIRLKAYDWKGNTDESAPVTFKIQHAAAVVAANLYCQQLDPMINEFVVGHNKFSSAYTKAGEGTMPYLDATQVFGEVGQQRRSLLDRLNRMTPPVQFAHAQQLFAAQIESAIKADDAAASWAGYMYGMQQNPYYYDPSYSAYAASSKEQVKSYSSETQGYGAQFQQEYNQLRQIQLGIPPGPNPNG